MNTNSYHNRRVWSARKCAAMLLVAGPLHAATHTINISGFAFQPASLTITVGDTVRWVNQDSVGHTSTCDNNPEPFCGASPLLAQGGSYSFTYTATGTYPYHCSPHPLMRGTVTVATANARPTVAITSPTNGASFTPPDIIAINVSAMDADGSIRSIEFFAGPQSLAVVTNAPYRYSIPAAVVPVGVYALTAVATDNMGLAATSAPVNVTVLASNEPPVVVIADPREGTVFTPPMLVSITANASDPDGTVRRVEFFANGIPIGVTTNTPFTYALPAAVIPAGAYALTARATDDKGAATDSAPVNARVRPPLRIVSSGFSSATQFRLSLTGAAALSYVLEGSANLNSWSPVSTNNVGADDFVLIDGVATETFRFYRVRQLPQFP